MLTRDQLRRELRGVVIQAISEYARSTRGANALGSDAMVWNSGEDTVVIDSRVGMVRVELRI